MRARGHLLVFLVAVLAQAWILGLPFQLDDYYLLVDPQRFFEVETAYADVDVPPFMLRWTQWAAWLLVIALDPEPLSPLPFHALGLLLHGLTAVFLARCVDAFAPREEHGRAGILAGIGFGLCVGHLQAVSWTSAWASLFYTLFGLIALDRFLRARSCAGRTALLHQVLAGLALYLALVSKTPGLVVVPALAVVLGLTGGGAWRRLGREAALVAGVGAAGLLTRLLYLGFIDPRYYEREAPGILDTAAGIPHGLAALGQGLYPWNADPLFAGEEPLLARLFGLGWSAPTIAWVVALLVLVGAAVLAGRARRATVVLALALAVCVLPAAEIYSGAANNVVSRTLYLPMAVLMAGLGIAGATLLARRRMVGIVAIGLVGAVLVDGGVHAARTELLNGRETKANRATIEGIVADHAAQATGRDLTILALQPPNGFADIPAVGNYLDATVAPPFVDERVDLRCFRDRMSLLRELPSLDLGAKDVIVLGPAGDANWLPRPADPQATAAENRARRTLRPLTELRRGRGTAADSDFPALVPAAGPGDGTQRWVLAAPLPAHALGAVRLTVEGASTGELLVGASSLVRYASPDVRGATVVVEPAFLPDCFFGPPLTEITWRGEGPPSRIELLPALPRLELLAPADGTEFALSAPAFAPPRWSVRRPPATTARFARLELTFRTHFGDVFPFYSDFDLVGAEEPFALSPATVHYYHGRPPMDPPLLGPAWSTFARERILPLLNQGRLRRITLDWRILLYREDGGITARSASRRLRLVLAEEDRPAAR